MGEMDGSAEERSSLADVSLAPVWHAPVHPYQVLESPVCQFPN